MIHVFMKVSLEDHRILPHRYCIVSKRAMGGAPNLRLAIYPLIIPVIETVGLRALIIDVRNGTTNKAR
jgi:hypothetical protein